MPLALATFSVAGISMHEPALISDQCLTASNGHCAHVYHARSPGGFAIVLMRIVAHGLLFASASVDAAGPLRAANVVTDRVSGSVRTSQDAAQCDSAQNVYQIVYGTLETTRVLSLDAKHEQCELLTNFVTKLQVRVGVRQSKLQPTIQSMYGTSMTVPAVAAAGLRAAMPRSQAAFDCFTTAYE